MSPAYRAPNIGMAVALALFAPIVALGGAYISQYMFGLFPCEMCWWQRYPHFVALGLALMALIVRVSASPLAPGARLGALLLTALAGLAILTSGLIGFYHAGVEYGFWEGATACSNISASTNGDFWADMMAVPVVRCDQPAFTLLGISMAGYNFLFSTVAALAIFALLFGRERVAASGVSEETSVI